MRARKADSGCGNIRQRHGSEYRRSIRRRSNSGQQVMLLSRAAATIVDQYVTSCVPDIRAVGLQATCPVPASIVIPVGAAISE